jgi:hypothetical protein
MRTQLRVGLALVLLIGSSMRAADQPSLDLSATLQPDSEGFHDSADVRLTLLITNRSADCKIMYVDPLLSPFQLDNRGVRVTLEVRDERQNRIETRMNPPPNVVPLQPADLVPLQCGHVYGSRIRLGSKTSWAYSLPQGRYEVRARIYFSTRRLFAHSGGLMKEFARLHNLSAERARAALAEGVVDSNWCPVSVEQ